MKDGKKNYQYYGNSCFIASLFLWWVILRNNVPMKQKKYASYNMYHMFIKV